jgi:hypothetical protein
MSGPKRIQRKRTKGWRMPEGAVYVGRPSRWGNPFVVGDLKKFVNDDNPLDIRYIFTHTTEQAVKNFRWLVTQPSRAEMIRAELAGRDLACWCPLDQPCHADVLLEVANQ